MTNIQIQEFIDESILIIKTKLARQYGLSPQEIEKTIIESDIEQRMRELPEVFMHLSDEQLIDCVR